MEEWLNQQHPLIILGWVSIVFAVRYILFAGLAYLYFWKWKAASWQSQRIHQRPPQLKQMRFEFLWSLSTCAIFGIIASFEVAFQIPQSRLYFDISERGWLYFGASVIFLILFHDLWFYWTHRLMHHPWIYPWTHKIHHRSIHPTPWASFSFHPCEALVQGLVLPVMIFLLPLHPAAIAIWLTAMTIMNVLGHLGVEIFSSGFKKSKFGSVLTTVTHHDAHHTQYRHNFSLYFNWWDKLFGTLGPL